MRRAPVFAAVAATALAGCAERQNYAVERAVMLAAYDVEKQTSAAPRPVYAEALPVPAPGASLRAAALRAAARVYVKISDLRIYR